MKTLVSIVYLTRNGGYLLGKSLDAVFAQKTDFKFEVIAIDSGSTDGTLELLEKFPVKVYRIPAHEFNFGLTRDYGFSLATGDIVIAISQDAIPVGSDWLNNMIYPFKDDSIVVVQGIDILPEGEDLFYWDKLRLFYYTRECKKWIEEHDNIGMSFTNCAIRRNIWKENLLGRVEMSEDKVFQKRIMEKRLKIYSQLQAKAFHSHMYNVKSLAKRCENEGMGWRNVTQNYSISDMICDIFDREIIHFLWRGIVTREIKRLSELLFPIIRPIYIYKGNHFATHYIK
ncbi:MAG: glycosyltransferase family 2 protein [Geobacteraceae bacterium]|nr:glycosyltransferase family 2 protein [Geobacteraceae bacterium]